jgi:hypothetical protein
LYDEARKVFNAMIDKRPVIARCANTADVVTAVNRAKNGLTVAVRSADTASPGWRLRGRHLIDLGG